MEKIQIFSLVISLISVIVTGATAIASILYFNKKKYLYEIKQKAILDALKLIDDYFSIQSFNNVPESNIIPFSRSEQDRNNLTLRARECFNQLILSCKSSELVECFLKIFFPHYYDPDGHSPIYNYKIFRELCRKELGIKQKINYESDEITFFAKVR